MRILLVESQSHDPFRNLALEDYLLRRMAGAWTTASPTGSPVQAILYLWQNEQTVVIGRNQNAWAECKTALLEAEGGSLARRTSGGGAVFHDLGNLNYSILLPEAEFDIDRTFRLIVGTVRRARIPAERSGRHDIMADGRKFSGNAFRLDHGIGLHHGTLLVSSDLDRVGRYLTAAPAALKIRGIASVRSPVTNLQKYRPDIDVRTWQTELAAAFICEFAGSNHPPGSVLQAQDRDFAADPLFSDLAAQFASWEWRFGETLAFDAELSETFAWGSVELMFHVNRGRVQTARLAGDNLDNAWADRIERAMIGQPFCSADLAQSLRTAASQPGGAAERQVLMAEDLAALIVRQGW